MRCRGFTKTGVIRQNAQNFGVHDGVLLYKNDAASVNDALDMLTCEIWTKHSEYSEGERYGRDLADRKSEHPRRNKENKMEQKSRKDQEGPFDSQWATKKQLIWVCVFFTIILRDIKM